MEVRGIFVALLIVPLAAAQSVAPGTFEHWKRLPFGTTATGSVYVPLDSWIYPEMERLVAWGYIDTAYLGLRPWTRLSIVRMLQGAEQRFEGGDASPEAMRVYGALRKEFEPDYREATRDQPRLHF
jgi:hypothetical protein